MPVLTTGLRNKTGSTNKAKVPATEFKLIKGAVSERQHSLLGCFRVIALTAGLFARARRQRLNKTEFSNNQKHRVH